LQKSKPRKNGERTHWCQGGKDDRGVGGAVGGNKKKKRMGIMQKGERSTD